VLLDVAALADKVVLGLGAGEAALGLGAELRDEARGSARNLALHKHGGGNASSATRVEVVRCVNGVRELHQGHSKDEAIDSLLVGAPLAGVRSDSNQVILGLTSGLWKPWLPS
jgi:hypothetical protein